ncbi:LytTR family DNA-binding domain-containing protein [Fulvivirgaceae bacterium BMA10]|uniref:LytTR family DNA-binding domain-containing protein n=1 Tax=Splendidivirga corallicola TaxID=3051826 RepID=A0ABT8KK59_9BACT|nr:LytTR family DNA-binding domain-containing protein [Fulvivirgaceae bacterium BMA10]
MKVLIIEDEGLASERLENMLKEINPAVEILDCIKSVDDAIDWLNANNEPDLIISDIQLSDGLCFDIYSEKRPDCPVIFTTAYDKYAIQAFEVNSIDYLLKPIQKEKLEQSLDKYASLNNSDQHQQDAFEQISKMLRQQKAEYKTRFLIRVGQKIKAIAVEKIAYFYTQDKMTYILTKEGQKYPVDHSLEEIDQVLDPKYFFRINRKFIVHIDAVKEINAYFKGRLKLYLTPHIEEDIVISSEKTPTFKAWLDQ